jgi:hypothetical protein
MSREKHGRYDQERHLPDNTMQPVGSGLYVWLHKQVRARFLDGEQLLEEAKKHRPSADSWLLGQLRARGADDLLEEFRVRKNADANVRDWENKRARLRQIEHRIQEEMDIYPVRVAWMQKEAAKLRRLIEKHERGNS